MVIKELRYSWTRLLEIISLHYKKQTVIAFLHNLKQTSVPDGLLTQPKFERRF